jgi:hypothetical protein
MHAVTIGSRPAPDATVTASAHVIRNQRFWGLRRLPQGELVAIEHTVRWRTLAAGRRRTPGPPPPVSHSRRAVGKIGCSSGFSRCLARVGVRHRMHEANGRCQHRCCRPTLLSARLSLTSEPSWRAAILTTDGPGALQPVRAPGGCDLSAQARFNAGTFSVSERRPFLVSRWTTHRIVL